MTMTTEELDAANKLLYVLDLQLSSLAKARNSAWGEYLEEFSRGEKFFYVSDRNGVIRTAQDASFVAERVFCVVSLPNPTGGVPYSATGLFLAVRDEATGRGVTSGVGINVSALVEDAGFRPTQVLQDMEFSTPSSWVPYPHTISVSQTDFIAKLPAEWLIPKCGVIRFFDKYPTGVAGDLVVGSPAGVQKIVLIGRKVYS